MSQIKNIIIEGLLLAAVMFVAAACITEPEARSLEPGSPLPSFSVTLSTGATLTSEELAQTGGAIVFFSTECGDCAREMPRVEQYYREHPEANIVCIARGEEQAVVAAWWEANGLTMPYAAPGNNDVYHLFASSGVPRIYVVAVGGIISATYGPDKL